MPCMHKRKLFLSLPLLSFNWECSQPYRNLNCRFLRRTSSLQWEIRKFNFSHQNPQLVDFFCILIFVHVDFKSQEVEFLRKFLTKKIIEKGLFETIFSKEMLYTDDLKNLKEMLDLAVMVDSLQYNINECIFFILLQLKLSNEQLSCYRYLCVFE